MDYNTLLNLSMKSSAFSFVIHNGGSNRITFVPLQPVKQCCSFTSLVRISLYGTSSSIPIIKPRPRTSTTCGSFSSLSLFIRYSPISPAFLIKSSFSMTSNTASAAAHAKWFPPNVVPS